MSRKNSFASLIPTSSKLCMLFVLLSLTLGCGEDYEGLRVQRLDTQETGWGSARGPIVAEGDGKLDIQLDQEPVLTFLSDFTETLSAPLHVGDQLTVRYDLERITSCKTTNRGLPQWQITGYYQVDDHEPVSLAVASYTSERLPQDEVIDIPEGEQIAFWFEIVDGYGCVAWDSNYGANYLVSIERDELNSTL